MKAYDCVQASRAKGRPTALSYIGAMIDGFVEMHGDRRFGDDPAVVAGVGYLNGMPITVVGIEKGGDTADKVRRNVEGDVNERNECLGVFLSQGRVSMKNVEKRRQLPADDPHHLDDAGVRRLEESQKHPDEQDMARACSFLREHLGGFA